MHPRSGDSAAMKTQKGEAVVAGSGKGRLASSVGLAALLVTGLGWVPSTPAAPAPVAAPALQPAADNEPVRQQEDDAAELATRTGKRVEVGALRDESRTVYAEPDGTMLAIEHIQPVRVIRDGKWTPVDATLVEGGDGSLGPRAATFGLRLSGGGAGPLLTADRAGRRFSLDWPGELPEPTHEGTQATYPNVLPDVDLVVNVSPDAFSHVLVIKNAEAAQNPRLREISFGLEAADLALRETPDGGIDAVDGAGGVVFEAAQPIMWDSGAPPATKSGKSKASRAGAVSPEPERAPSDASEKAPLDVEVAADRITLVPDREMLTSPDTRWPVYVDPIYKTSKRSAYTMVAKGYPTESYWSFDKKDTEGVGKCPVSSGTCNGSGVKQLFYTVPTPYLGKNIIEADFAVTMTHAWSTSPRDLEIFKADAGISKSTTWNNKPGSAGLIDTISPTGTRDTCADGQQNVRFDVKKAFPATYTGKSVTFGLRAGDEGDETAWKRFCGNGQLEIKYNQAPNVPSTAKLTSSPGGKCRSGAGRPVVPESPTFYMYVSDPDHSSEHKQDVRAEIRFSWRTSTGTTATKTVRTGAKAGDGKTRLQATPTGLPQNTVISWEVRAQDQDEWYSDWSSPACEYVLDTKAPPAADIDSPDFLPLESSETTAACAEDNEIREYAGRYSTFTFDSPGTDTTKYRYGLDEDPVHELVPRKADGSVNPGGPVSVRLMPDVAGEHVVNVVAYDAAGNNTESSCRFTIATRKGAGEWLLSDPAGATQAADTSGDHPLDIRPGVTLGVPGPGCASAKGECKRDRAARFAGNLDAYLTSRTSALVDTSQSFAVSAWVRLTDTGQDRVAVSQDGTGEYGFMLGFDYATKRWSFEVPVNDVNTLGLWTSRSDTEARVGEWTHLVGVFDKELHSLQLIVNGVGQKAVQNRTPWKSRGAVQIGRLIDKGGYRDPWIGDLSDVSVFDRVVPPREAAMMAKLRPVRLGYWPLTSAPSARSAEFDGNTARDLVLENGAKINAPDLEADPYAEPALVGAGEMVLDGVDDRARTNAAVAPMNGSFTISARVRLAASDCVKDMTVISQAASKTSGFRIRCSARDQWELVVPHVDVAAPTAAETTTVVETARYPDDSQDGQHLALVYNAFTKELWFYVDGQLAQVEPAEPPTVVNASGPLQIGRAMVGGTYGEYFAGVIDDVRVYSGIVDPATVALMAQRKEQPQL